MQKDGSNVVVYNIAAGFYSKLVYNSKSSFGGSLTMKTYETNAVQYDDNNNNKARF